MNSQPTIAEQLSPLLPDDARTWLESVLGDRALLCQRTRLRVAFAQCARKLRAVQDTLVRVDDEPWLALEAARASLILAAFDALSAEEQVALVEELYRTGEQREQVSVLRTLPRLPQPERFGELAIQACRTNSLEVFRAIAADNDYPAQHFPELHFNQLVLKAIFLGVAVTSIRGLSERATPELKRMVREYADERRAAGRSVPDDVDYVLTLSSR